MIKTSNLAWIGTWAVTGRCNLNCTYCHPRRLRPDEAEDIDYDSAIDKIERVGPKVLNLSGGEPSLVEDLPRILERIKNRWNPFIRIVNNGTNTSRLLRCLPYFDRLVVSLDGLGEVNRRTRGIDGDKVLERVEEFTGEARSGGHATEVVINQVITVDNALQIGDLCRRVAEIDPDMEVAVSALVPNDHPKAITLNPEVRTRFWELYEDLRGRGYKIWHHFEHFKTDKPVKVVKCYNQYFVVRFWPDGTSWTCTPNTASAFANADGYARRLLSKPSLLPKAVRYGVRMLTGSIRSGPSFTCNIPCNCEAWIDTLITGGDHPNLEYYFRPLWGRFTEGEVDRAYRWIREYVNEEFPRERLSPLLQTR